MIRRGGLLAALVLLTCCAAPDPPPRNADPAPMTFGVLAATCDPARAAAERRAGLTSAVLDLAWDRYQPTPGSADPGYVRYLRAAIGNCRAAGLRVVLGLGLQYPPAWVRALPGAAFLGPSGTPSARGEVDVVFSGAVRDAVAGYLTHLAADVGFAGVAAVRVGTNATGELGYPGPGDAGGDHEYWGFGVAAQRGEGLAPGAASSPLPGWVPGQPGWRDRPVSAVQVTAWFDWYTGSLARAVEWQMDRLRGLGFTGRFHVPVAGRGVLPADRAAAVAARLDGSADPDGSLERGLDYPSLFPRLALAGHDVDIDLTGLDDDTAVRQRNADPGAETCHPDDVVDLLDRPDTATWSAQRWTGANARLVGLPLVGENPGPPGSPFTGGSADSDTSARQLVHAPGYARDCGLTEFHWAFESDLFTPGSGVDLDDYARTIATPPGRTSG